MNKKLLNGNDSETLPFWSVPLEELYHRYETSAEGLTSQSAAERLQKYGRNEFKERSHLSALKLFLRQVKSPLLIILVSAAIISVLLYDWLDAVIILTIVSISTLISFRQEHSAQKAVEELKALIAVKSKVLRDGQVIGLPAAELVPGDIVLLSAGSLIPADGRILEANDLFVNEAALTGESFPSEKNASTVSVGVAAAKATNAVFMGTSVRSGSGRIILTHTGFSTKFGAIAQKLQSTVPENDFERGVRSFSYLLTRIILVLVVLVFAINIIDQKSTFESLLFAIALAVGMTPELLPAIITITLSHGARKMAKQGLIVKKLSAIQTLGSMDVFCSDKTGTLTEGVIRLDRSVDHLGLPSSEVAYLAYVNAYFQQGLENPMDEALRQLAKDQSVKMSDLIKIGEIPYDFIRKRLTVGVEGHGTTQLISKGAFKQILSICSSIKDNGVEKQLSPEISDKLLDQYRQWGEEGYRVLGVASKQLKSALPIIKKEEHDFTFRGFLLFSDAPKAGITEVIADLKGRGVQLKILTGDNRFVTAHLAGQIGMDRMAMVTGDQLEHMREEALSIRVGNTDIFAELDPHQKERVIRALKRSGHVVGYLGDGINDATALYEADIGISVDSAVDVAKDSADLVLLEHDLDILNDTIREGRTTFANTMKYILTTSSANFGNMISMAAASAFLPFLPLLAKQILLNNLLSDVPGMSLAGDRVDEETLQKPQQWSIKYIRNFMIVFGLTSTAFDFLIFGTLLLLLDASPDEFRTAWFLESLITEVLIIFVLRTRNPFYRSRPSVFLMINAAAVLLFSCCLLFLPISEITGFVPLSGSFWIAILVISLLYVVATESLKRWRHIQSNRPDFQRR